MASINASPSSSSSDEKAEEITLRHISRIANGSFNAEITRQKIHDIAKESSISHYSHEEIDEWILRLLWHGVIYVLGDKDTFRVMNVAWEPPWPAEARPRFIAHEGDRIFGEGIDIYFEGSGELVIDDIARDVRIFNADSLGVYGQHCRTMTPAQRIDEPGEENILFAVSVRSADFIIPNMASGLRMNDRGDFISIPNMASGVRTVDRGVQIRIPPDARPLRKSIVLRPFDVLLAGTNLDVYFDDDYGCLTVAWDCRDIRLYNCDVVLVFGQHCSTRTPAYSVVLGGRHNDIQALRRLYAEQVVCHCSNRLAIVSRRHKVDIPQDADRYYVQDVKHDEHQLDKLAARKNSDAVAVAAATRRQIVRELDIFGERYLNHLQRFPFGNPDVPFNWTAAIPATDSIGQISRNWQWQGELHDALAPPPSVSSFRFGNAAEHFNMRTDSADTMPRQTAQEFESLVRRVQRGVEYVGDLYESSMQVNSSATAVQSPQREDRPDDSPVLDATATTTPKATVNQCCVCLEPIGELWAFRPCGHANVCHPCIEKWERAARSFTCPTCRRDVTETMRIYVT